MKQADKIKLAVAVVVLLIAFGLIGWQLGLFGSGAPAAPQAPAQLVPEQQPGGGAQGADAPLSAQ